MVRNLWRGYRLLWVVIALACPGSGWGQVEEGEQGVQGSPESAVGASAEELASPDEADTVVDELQESPLSEIQEFLRSEGEVRDRASREQFAELRDRVEVLAERGNLLKKPVTWVFLGFFFVLPLAFFLLGFWLMQRLALQNDELRRQRLRLEGVEESLRELPKNLPNPTVDVVRLADHLRADLSLGSSPEAAMPAAETSPVAAEGPFYHNDDWLQRTIQGPRAFLEYLQGVRGSVAQIYEELGESDDPGEALALTAWMFSRFFHRRRQGGEERWAQLLRVAEESGFVNDPDLSERLLTAKTDEEAARTLHRALYREVFEQGISDHLILLEEMRHLPNFCGEEASYDACRAIAQRIDPMVEEFLGETRRLVGYTPNYVPLFSEFTDEAARFLRNNATERLPGVYQHLNLPRRQVLCVLAYGLRRERGWENEETQVILS